MWMEIFKTFVWDLGLDMGIEDFLGFWWNFTIPTQFENILPYKIILLL
jgi:hypothetical protein